jgi:hypothetical protein
MPRYGRLPKAYTRREKKVAASKPFIQFCYSSQAETSLPFFPAITADFLIFFLHFRGIRFEDETGDVFRIIHQ